MLAEKCTPLFPLTKQLKITNIANNKAHNGSPCLTLGKSISLLKMLSFLQTAQLQTAEQTKTHWRHKEAKPGEFANLCLVQSPSQGQQLLQSHKNLRHCNAFAQYIKNWINNQSDYSKQIVRTHLFPDLYAFYYIFTSIFC